MNQFIHKIIYTCVVSMSFFFSSNAQFTTIGNQVTTLGNGVYKLTDPINGQYGYIWRKEVYDLTKPLLVEGQLYFGDQDGADGICFVMQDQCTSASGAAVGGGIGYSGMKGKSIAIEFDTYRNFSGGGGDQDNNDPDYDHIAVVQMGIVDHGNALNTPLNTIFGAPKLISGDPLKPDVEDGNYHDYKITYDPGTKHLKVYFDNILRLDAPYDILTNVFGGNPLCLLGL